MKCTICGKEFGEGATCQNCGVDRVTGLGNYSGYSAPSTVSSKASVPQSVNPHQNVTIEPKIVKVDSIVCYSCGEIIPADSKFCPHCSKDLWVKCPQCGKTYSSQYPACQYCGTNRAEYYERERKRNEQALKIIEAERKRKEKERIEREKARKQHEEWLKTPEGQAELERKRKAEEEAKKLKQKAEQIKKDCELKAANAKPRRIVIGLGGVCIPVIIILGLMGRGGGSWVEELIVTLLFPLAIVIFFVGLYYLILGIATAPQDYIDEYKRCNPKDPVNKHL